MYVEAQMYSVICTVKTGTLLVSLSTKHTQQTNGEERNTNNDKERYENRDSAFLDTEPRQPCSGQARFSKFLGLKFDHFKRAVGSNTVVENLDPSLPLDETITGKTDFLITEHGSLGGDNIARLRSRTLL